MSQGPVRTKLDPWFWRGGNERTDSVQEGTEGIGWTVALEDASEVLLSGLGYRDLARSPGDMMLRCRASDKKC